MLQSISSLGTILNKEDLKVINGSGKAIDHCCKPPIHGRSAVAKSSSCECFPSCANSPCGCPCENKD